MLKRLAAITALAFVALAVLTTPAGAQQYPPAGASVTASAQAAVKGQPVTFTAKGFKPGTTVTFKIFSDPITLGTAVADSTGTATLTAQIPSSLEFGNHTVQASGVDPAGNPLTVSLPIVVAPRVVNGVPIFARTGAGSSTTAVARGGAALLAVGALLVLITRQRRTRHAAAA